MFLTNKLPGVLAKLHIEVDDIRAHNPQIIYVRGTGQGARGPDADKGSYDSLAFWCRSGIALGVKRPDYDHVPGPPGPGFGDSIGAMTIAGGIMGALFHRERTGEATIVDVSLLGTGLWAMGQAVALSLLMDVPMTGPPPDRLGANPLVGNYLTKDGRFLAFTCLQAGKYWPPMCEVIERPELATDPRFADHASLMAHSIEAAEVLRDAFAERTLGEWRERLADFVGQWTVVQDTLEAAADPQIGRQRLRAGLRDRRRHPVPTRRGTGPVRRGARGAGTRAGVQRARRRHPHRPRARLGHHRRPQSPRRHRLKDHGS